MFCRQNVGQFGVAVRRPSAVGLSSAVQVVNVELVEMMSDRRDKDYPTRGGFLHQICNSVFSIEYRTEF
jgi:hypothetical protein